MRELESSRDINDDNMVNAILDALFDGLQQQDRQLWEACLLALASFGPTLIPVLDAKGNETSSKPLLRQRIGMTVDFIEEAVKQNKSLTTAWIRTAIFECLRLDSPDLNRKALLAAAALPSQIVDELLSLAVYNCGNVSYCKRLLDAAKNCDRIPQIDQHLEVMILTGHRNKAIRLRAKELVRRYKQRTSSSL